MTNFGKYDYSQHDISKPLHIIGAGELARIAARYFSHDSPFSIAGFVVDDEFKDDSSYLGYPLLSTKEFKAEFEPAQVNIFVAFSGTQLSLPRSERVREMKLMGYSFASYVSSYSFLDSDSSIGSNVFVFEHNTIQSEVMIGDSTIVWSGNHIGHQTSLGEGNFISSHVCIGGRTKVAENCYFGMNSTVRDQITIGARCVVGANSYVSKSQVGNSVIFGTPAKPIRGMDPLEAVK